MADVANIIGVLGVIILLTGYFLLQTGKIRSEGISFSMLNLIGSLMILFSLFFAWNLAAALIEAAWAVISLFGIVRVLLRRKNI